jgi:hypothetical protein
VPVGVTGHQTQRPRGQVGPPGPHTQPNPAPHCGPRGRTVANIAASGPSDRAAGPCGGAVCGVRSVASGRGRGRCKCVRAARGAAVAVAGVALTSGV